ncbi:NACHT domain-containing protein [Phytomonospora sp. NPDC050363]|uniref:NACHT domain-containing protein n=1 Tax=Phytomonospora sp. NPDC050363 TaxID=3155642 RepID=UPI0034064FED
MQSHPFPSVLILTAYFAILFVTKVLKRVVEPAIEEWINRSAHAFYGVAWRYKARYLERLKVSLRYVQLLGVKTSTQYAVQLPDVYVDLSLRRRAAAGSTVGRIDKSERLSPDAFIDAHDSGVFVIVGGPGSGKTTLLRVKALRLASNPRRRSRLPIILELRQHAKSIIEQGDKTIATLAAALDWLHGSHSAAWFDRKLQRGECLVMLDGLDEVADEADRRKVVDWVRGQTHLYPRNMFLVTSRPHGYRANRLDNADELEVRRFTSEQIRVFVHNWYRVKWTQRTGLSDASVLEHAAEEAEDLIERLRKTPALFRLAENPLLLTMITNVHIIIKVLPGSRAALYEEICEMLLHRRQEAKSIRGGDEGLTPEQKFQVCQTLASYMMLHRVRDLPIGEAQQVVRDVLASASTRVTPEDFLAEAENNGLLVQPAEGQYAFAHLTFQEYLAAMAFRETDGTEALAALIDESWWYETTLLWAAGADATRVVEACIAKGTAQALRLALACASEARGIERQTRVKLERMQRDAAGEDDLSRRQTLIGAQVGHTLSDLVWLSSETVFSAKPVSNEVFGFFLRDLNLHRRGPDSPAADEAGPALGMWDNDAVRFIAWVNRLPGVDGPYRLPTEGELCESPLEEIAGIAGRAIWMQGETSPLLYYTPDAPVEEAHLGVLERVRVQVDGFIESLRKQVRPIQVRTLLDVCELAAKRAAAPPGYDHLTVVTKLLGHLRLAQVIAPSSRMAKAIGALQSVRAKLRQAEIEQAATSRRGASALAPDVQEDYRRQMTDERRRALVRELQRRPRRLLFVNNRTDRVEAAVAGNLVSAMDLAEAEIAGLIPRLERSIARLRLFAGKTSGEDPHAFLSSPADQLDALVDGSLQALYVQAQSAPGGIGSMVRAVLYGLWRTARATDKRSPKWGDVEAIGKDLLAAAAGVPRQAPGSPGSFRPGAIPDALELLLKGLTARLAERSTDGEDWRTGVLRIVQDVRTTLTPMLLGEVAIDVERIAFARLELGLISLTRIAEDYVPVLHDINYTLARIEQRELSEAWPPSEVLLLVRA